MSRFTRYRAASIIGATSAVALLAGTAVAGAYNVVPGADDTGKVVITGVSDLGLDLETSEDGSSVAITVTNSGDRNFVCAGPKGNEATTGDITDAAVVAQAMEYYQSQLNRDPSDILVKISGFGGSTNAIPTGSVEGFLPGGALGSLFGDAFEARDEIRASQDQARIAGHTADILKFNINAGAEHEVTVNLGDPSVSPRAEFDAGAFLLCSSGGDLYAFAGYENGAPAAPATSSLASLGSGS